MGNSKVAIQYFCTVGVLLLESSLLLAKRMLFVQSVDPRIYKDTCQIPFLMRYFKHQSKIFLFLAELSKQKHSVYTKYTRVILSKTFVILWVANLQKLSLMILDILILNYCNSYKMTVDFALLNFDQLAEIYIQSAPNNSDETHTFMCMGRPGCFGQH